MEGRSCVDSGSGAGRGRARSGAWMTRASGFTLPRHCPGPPSGPAASPGPGASLAGTVADGWRYGLARLMAVATAAAAVLAARPATPATRAIAASECVASAPEASSPASHGSRRPAAVGRSGRRASVLRRHRGGQPAAPQPCRAAGRSLPHPRRRYRRRARN